MTRQPRSNSVSCALKAISLFFIGWQFFSPGPLAHAAAASDAQPALRQVSDTAVAVKVNRTVPTAPASDSPRRFSGHPTAGEISHAQIFSEPLQAKGKGTDRENADLAAALTQFSRRNSAEDFSAPTNFLKSHPSSAWRISLLSNLATGYFQTGYFSKALDAWEEVWSLGKNETDPAIIAVVDEAVGQLAKMNARLGRMERLESLFAELKGRVIHGSATELLVGAREGLWLMKNKPELAFRCGPMALDRIRAYGNPADAFDPKIDGARSTPNGMSLVQLKELADALGMRYQMAKRDSGSSLILPAVVHWKAKHYAAILKEENGLYLIQDPTFRENFWVSQEAVESEASGYFLVPEGNLPQGWHSVTADYEGQNVWGKGNTGGNDPDRCKKCDDQAGGGCSSCGMAQYNMHTMLVSLNVSDTPIFYTPPRGPSVSFTATYNQRDANQPATFSYSNLGSKWTFNWLSYITDNSLVPSADAKLYAQGGGAETYTGYNATTQTYAPQADTHAVLVRTSASSYERRLSDGSIEIFDAATATVGAGRKVFLTQIIDPAGNPLKFTYDSSFRLVAVTDALEQVTNIAYTLSGDPLKITRVTDCFGRYASFEYTNGELSKITDMIGLTSQFTYTDGFLSTLTTDYGTTSFAYGDITTDPNLPSSMRWLEVTDPLGAKERLEYRHDAPGIAFSDPSIPQIPGGYLVNSYLNYRNSFYWNKKAMAEAPGDYTKAKITHWLHTADGNAAAGVKESEKMPLENRVWYVYPNQSNSYYIGSDEQPIAKARVLDDGTTQIYRYENNVAGNPTKTTDPLGRVTTYVYDSNNIDVLAVYQQNPEGTSIDGYGVAADKLAAYTYNDLHKPLTSTDAAGQTVTCTYNGQGQMLTRMVVRNGQNETTTWDYDSAGYLQSVTGPVTGAVTSYTYDGFGRIQTVTDSEGYVLNYGYDALNRQTTVTYPGGSYEQTTYKRLDLEWKRDREGRWTHFFYDELRHLAMVTDALGRTIHYDWCPCGVLEGITDGNGNHTGFLYDIQSRLTDKIYADQTGTSYEYENTTSRLKTVTDAKGQVATYTYFVDNNLQQLDYTNAAIATPSVSFLYDAVYDRRTTMNDGTGATGYGYYPVQPGTLGAGKLERVDGPLANDTVILEYDELGRVKTRSINGSANSSTVIFDALGRLTSETNPLSTDPFNYFYVNTTGRLDHVDYPNGQKTVCSYYPNASPSGTGNGDKRLQEIRNLQTDGTSVLSKFDYTYSPVGDITVWTRQIDAMTPQAYSLDYDLTDQLLGGTLKNTSTNEIIKQYTYRYDLAQNRTSEQVDSAASESVYNNLNQLTNRSGGGTMVFEGDLNEPGTVTVGGNPATVNGSNHFKATATVTAGTNSIPLVATDASGNTTTKSIQVNVTGIANQSPLYDLNGNMTDDASGRTFEWDALNRCTAINYPGSGNRTEFTYNGVSQRVKIVEKAGGSLTSTKQFVWFPGTPQPSEERDGDNRVTRRFYRQGEQIGGASYFFTSDHLGSIREMTDSSGTIHARYDYDPYGRMTKLSGDLDSDFSYAGYYNHSPSGLCGTLYRFYSADFGRWLSRDPIGSGSLFLGLEQSRFRLRTTIGELYIGPNLYEYVDSDPIGQVDRLGLQGSGASYDYICQSIMPDGAVEFSMHYKSKNCDSGKASKCCENAGVAYNAYQEMMGLMPGKIGAFGSRAGYFLALGDYLACMKLSGY